LTREIVRTLKTLARERDCTPIDSFIRAGRPPATTLAPSGEKRRWRVAPNPDVEGAAP